MTIHVLVGLFNNIVAKEVLVTLLQSLWLGAIVALLGAVIMLLTRKSSSELRYKLLTGLLTFFLISMGYVFYNAINIDAKVFNTNTIIPDKAITQQAQSLPQQKDIIATLIYFIKTNADIIISIWFAVICFKCTQLISGLYALHNLKKRNITEA